MKKVSLGIEPRRWLCAFALVMFAAAAAGHASPGADRVGTLKVERHGDHGPAVILIPGRQGGSWVWQRTIDQLQKDHVVYAVTLAGFDGVPAPGDGGNLFDRADASLLQLIRRDRTPAVSL